MTYLGQDNDFVNSPYFLTLFVDYIKPFLGALPASNAFFDFCVALSLSRNVTHLHIV